MRLRIISSIILLYFFFYNLNATQDCCFSLKRGENIDCIVGDINEECVYTALDILSRDLNSVLSANLALRENRGKIVIISIEHTDLLDRYKINASGLIGKTQSFIIKVYDGRLFIVGSDAYGMVYGIIELTKMLGVSAWEWWSDVYPQQKDSFVLEEGFYDIQCPSIKYRGIFINDEDWGLLPWSAKIYERNNRLNVIGPKTTQKIFELLMRLKANTYWPPMHECTNPFL